MTVIAEKLIQARFLREFKNRFLCEVEINDCLVECYVPSSCRLANFFMLDGKQILLRRNSSQKVRTQYALVAIPYKRSYILLNSSFANRVIEGNIRGRRFCFLGKRSKIFKEHRVEDYKTDLYISDSKTIVEIKSIISTDNKAVFPTVYSERAIKQLEGLKELQQKGYNVCYIIVSLNPYVSEIILDTTSRLFELFNECQILGMKIKAFSCKLKENKLFLGKEIPIVETLESS
jgi:DNA-binding sugar fermentation-stimulating protein